MSILRSRRLESLFGTRLEEVTAEHVIALVDNGVTESFDLDFKQELYGRTDKDRRDLAGDVAALANTAGGIIVIGVAEDEQAKATAADGVQLSDAEKGRMLQVIASGVSPMPDIEILPVPFDAGENETEAAGFYLVAVNRSLAAPHAVLVNEGFRFPKRNGPTTRYLSEPEVAAEYRQRFGRISSQGDRVEQVEDDIRSHLTMDALPWLVVSLVPDIPGDLELTDALRQRFAQEIIGKESWDVFRMGTSFQRASVRRRRLVADGSGSEDSRSKWVAAEFHCDGAAAYAVYIADLAATSGTFDQPTPREQLASDEGLVLGVLTGLHRGAKHARDRAGAGGSALVRATLVPSFGCTIAIGHNRGFRDSRGAAYLSDAVSAETVADLDDLADSGPALVAATARLSDDIAQAFGIAELGQVTREGGFRRRYWRNDNQSPISMWAESFGVEVSDETLS